MIVTAGAFNLNMDSPSFLFTQLSGASITGTQTSTTWTANTPAGDFFSFVGTDFGTLVGLVPSTGTITQLTWATAGQTMATFSGSIDWNPLYAALNGGGFNAFVNGLYGGTDTINGSNLANGGDALVGYGGADVLYGNAGNDRLFGDEGSFVTGSGVTAGNDTLFGGTGDDSLWGGGADDSLDGAAGNDQLDGGAGNDLLDGGAGDDRLTSGSGVDTILGGDGTDFLILDRASATVGVSLLETDLRSATGITLADGTVIRSIEQFDIKLGQASDGFTANVQPIGNFSRNAVDGGTGAGVDIATLDYSWSSSEVLMSLFSVAGTVSYTVNTNFRQHSLQLTNFERFFITGGAASDTFYTGNGNDQLSGGAGDDYLFASAGDDVLNGGDGRDRLFGDLGNDTINGDAGDDEITYSSGVDVIDGGVGFDALSIDFSASSQSQNISAAMLTGAGGLTLANGTSIVNMETFGEVKLGSGNDTLTLVSTVSQNSYFQTSGGAGTDLLILDMSASVQGRFTFNETFRLNSGGTTYSEFERFELRGGSGGDDFSGMDGNDLIYGNLGNDRLRGFGGADSIYGGDGDDTIEGGGALDFLDGGAGDDLIDLGFTNEADTVDGGAGIDRVKVNLGFTTTNQIIDASTVGSAAGATFSNGLVLRNIESFEQLTLGSGNDSVTVSTVPRYDNIFDGGLGNDTISIDLSSRAASNIDPNTFTNNGLSNGYRFDIYPDNYRNFEVIRYVGSNFGDLMASSYGSESFFGGAGNDTMFAGTGGYDLMFGEAGTDIFAFTYNNFINSGATLDGGDGSDIISLDLKWLAADTFIDTASLATATGISLAGGNVFRNIEVLRRVELGSGNDNLTVRNAHLISNELNSGAYQSFNASMSGGDGSDYLYLDYKDLAAGSVAVEDFGFGLRVIANGFTLIASSFEAITIVGSQRQDGMSGTQGGDRFEGLGGNDVLNGLGGADLVYGGDGDDTLIGELGGDFLDGQAGNDVLDGGDGDDTLAGGTGTNQFFGGLGFDVAILTGLTDSYFLNMANWFPGGPNIIMGSNTLSSIEGVTLGSGNDTMVGTTDRDWLGGGSGNDFLTSGNGDDAVAGGHGSDIIIMGDGRDVGYTGLTPYDDFSVGSASDVDYVYAGNGDDVVYAGSLGLEVILGEAGDDFLSDTNGTFTYMWGGSGNNYMSSNAAVNVFLSEGGHDTMLGNSGDSFYYRLAAGSSLVTGGQGIDQFIGGAALSNDDVSGLAGNDYLFGGNGNDILRGGAGNDVIIGQVGNDTLEGGAGVNLLWANDAGSDQILVNVADGGTQVVEFFEAGGASDLVRLLGASITSFAGIQNLITNIGVVQAGNLMVNAGSGAQLYLDVGANQTAIWFQGVSAYSLTSADFLFG
jgi:Ca2+-binding RTX toxin-like protein